MTSIKKIPLKEAIINQLKVYSNPVEDVLAEIKAEGIKTIPKGFINWGETVSFWERHKSVIKMALKTYCEKQNENFIQVISNWEPEFDDYQIAKAVCGNYNYKYDAIYNRLTLFALEYVAKQT